MSGAGNLQAVTRDEECQKIRKGTSQAQPGFIFRLELAVGDDHGSFYGCSILLTLTLAACGTSKTERGVSGGLLGAAGGAGLGAMTGTSTLGGAALGGAAGAATGILTAPKKHN